jgi:hypothetical protein
MADGSFAKKKSNMNVKPDDNTSLEGKGQLADNHFIKVARNVPSATPRRRETMCQQRRLLRRRMGEGNWEEPSGSEVSTGNS